MLEAHRSKLCFYLQCEIITINIISIHTDFYIQIYVIRPSTPNYLLYQRIRFHM